MSLPAAVGGVEVAFTAGGVAFTLSFAVGEVVPTVPTVPKVVVVVVDVGVPLPWAVDIGGDATCVAAPFS